MHGPIRDRLEELLNSRSSQADLGQHLASCSDCNEEVNLMQQQAAWLKTLRAPEEVDPAPGFYARVLQRIEEEGVRSVWLIFADGPFGRWLAYASLAVALVLTTWIVGSEREDKHMGPGTAIAQQTVGEPQTPVAGDQAHQRDVVLVNLAAYSQQTE